MTESYTEFNFKISPLKPAVDILIAELSDIGFDGFDETEEGLLAYIPSQKVTQNLLEEVPILHSLVFDIAYTQKTIKPENWNALWESQFQPIVIDGQCCIRAADHPPKDVAYDIVINPKMAFGTGHHATTHLMINFLLNEKIKNKYVLDMGCGTGVLAILAAMKKAKTVDAIDIDRWSYENTLENITQNNCPMISVYKGDAHLLNGMVYDVILANINRNILLRDIKTYAAALAPKGVLFMSGFYEKDLPLIKTESKKHGLSYQIHQEKEDWVAVKMLNHS